MMSRRASELLLAIEPNVRLFSFFSFFLMSQCVLWNVS